MGAESSAVEEQHRKVGERIQGLRVSTYGIIYFFCKRSDTTQN